MVYRKILKRSSKSSLDTFWRFIKKDIFPNRRVTVVTFPDFGDNGSSQMIYVRTLSARFDRPCQKLLFEQKN